MFERLPAARRPAALLPGCAALTLAALVLVLPGRPRAGNDDSYLMGSEAAMAGGAVTAVTRDAGAVWYNPAGLGGNRRSKIDISTSAFVFYFRRMPHLLVTELEEQRLSGGVDAFDIRSVPAALSYVRNINDRLSIGVGLFNPINDALSVTSSLSQITTFPSMPDATAAYQQRVEISWDRSRYYLGPAVGWELLPNLRIGGALFLTVGFDDERFLTLGEGHVAESGEEQRYSMRQTERDAITVGSRAVIALQWQPNRRLSLGIVVRSPELSFYRWGSASMLTDATPGLLLDEPEGGLDHRDRSLTGGGVEQVAPWRFHLGLAFHFDRGWFSFEADFQTPLENAAFDIDRRWIWNARVGSCFRVSELVSMGAGFYTDHGGARRGDTIGSWRVAFYGATLGIELRTPIAVRRRENDDEPLIFSTTVAAQYGLGRGESLGYFLQARAADNPGFQGLVRDVTFHELTVHISSAMFF